jgi:DNA processing protein
MPLGVVVVEGAQYSGSLITARLAMEFGREVFGVPGNVTQPVSFAPNQLIKQGAKLITNGADVIEELPTPVRAALVQSNRKRSSAICWLQRRSIPRKKRFTTCRAPMNQGTSTKL